MHLRNCLQRKDLLQLMIDATDSETQKGLEGGEIVADSVGFMLAGYETTSTALTFATYLLAANPEAQERLANEIHEYFDENPVSDRGFLANYACTVLLCRILWIVLSLHRTNLCMMPRVSCSTLIWCLRRL